eukprot:TRINITY_DN1333_c0_g1_i1.p1 TRINITY_DN1333_c0_g1~~TRINITY_DN1333_c0_g1_i1.p1  ORF type:complete len:1068 (-),score=109.70 TRINITY_DN1333_c0_g1_i1:141-3344(-)
MTDELMCRVCRDISRVESLTNPCKCKGSIKWVHHHCLLSWICHSKSMNCEMCGQTFRLVKSYSEKAKCVTLPDFVSVWRQGFQRQLTRLVNLIIWVTLRWLVAPLSIGIICNWCLLGLPEPKVVMSTGRLRLWSVGVASLLGYHSLQLLWNVWCVWYKAALHHLTASQEPTATQTHHRDGLQTSTTMPTPHKMPSNTKPLQAQDLPQTIQVIAEKQQRRNAFAIAVQNYLSITTPSTDNKVKFIFTTSEFAGVGRSTRLTYFYMHQDVYTLASLIFLWILVPIAIQMILGNPIHHTQLLLDDYISLACRLWKSQLIICCVLVLKRWTAPDWQLRAHILLLNEPGSIPAKSLQFFAQRQLPKPIRMVPFLVLFWGSVFLAIAPDCTHAILIALASSVAALEVTISLYWHRDISSTLVQDKRGRLQELVHVKPGHRLTYHEYATLLGITAADEVPEIKNALQNQTELKLILAQILQPPAVTEPEIRSRAVHRRRSISEPAGCTQKEAFVSCLRSQSYGEFPRGDSPVFLPKEPKSPKIETCMRRHRRHVKKESHAHEHPFMEPILAELAAELNAPKSSSAPDDDLFEPSPAPTDSWSDMDQLDETTPCNEHTPVQEALPQVVSPSPVTASNASKSQSMGGALIGFIRFSTELGYVIFFLPACLGLLMTWILAPYFQAQPSDDFDVEAAEGQRGLWALVVNIGAWINSAAIPNFSEYATHWLLGIVYLAVGIVFEHSVIKPVLNPNTDLWLFRCREDPDDEESWSSLLVDVLKEPLWRTITGYAKGLVREIVVLLLFVKAPIKLTRKLLPKHVFPMAVYPLTDDNQYAKLVHLIDTALVVAMLVAVLQTLPVKEILRRICYNFLATVGQHVGLGNSMLNPDAQILYADEVDEASEFPPASTYVFLRKFVVLLVAWASSMIVLTLAGIVPVILADSLFSIQDSIKEVVLKWVATYQNIDELPSTSSSRRLDPLLHLLILLVFVSIPKIGSVSRAVGNFFCFFAGLVLLLLYFAYTTFIRPVVQKWRSVSKFVSRLLLNPTNTVDNCLNALKDSTYDELYLEGLHVLDYDGA